MGFRNRIEAGRLLARKLEGLRGEEPVVVGLPRGGVPVASEVARALDAPLDVIVVRKVGVPWQPELAMGAAGEDGVNIIHTALVRATGVSPAALSAAKATAAAEVDARVRALRGSRARIPLKGRTVVVVDDGIATGATARAACRVARAQGAARVVVAVPVAPPGAAAALADVADEFVCLRRPDRLEAVGQFYDDFTATTDEEVWVLLDRADEITVDLGGLRLAGRLHVPPGPRGVVVFTDSSGSGRNSPRNRYVAGCLHRAGMATLLLDLLTTEEEDGREPEVDLLATRLLGAMSWVRDRPEATGLPVGLFGAGTGAAAALRAAAAPGVDVAAVVSRGGRIDLAASGLGAVRAPTLLIVGELDETVLELNRAAQTSLHCVNRLAVVPEATHLFAEPGALPTVARLAADWFLTGFAPDSDARWGPSDLLRRATGWDADLRGIGEDDDDSTGSHR